MQPTTDRIFVSYSRQDEVFARKIAVWLANTLGVGVWIDIDDIQPGVKWSSAIQDGLDNCEVMVVIVTPDSMKSVNVEDEWQYFIDLGKPVVPILLRSAPIPYQLRRIQWIDFSDRDDYNNSLRQLIVEVRKHIKPMAGEIASGQRSSRGGVVKSRKDKRKQRDIKDAESLIQQQSRALKRTNRLVTMLVGLLVVVGLGVGGFVAYVYFTQPPFFIIQGDTSNAVALLPGATETIALSELDGRARAGTQIQAGGEPLTLSSQNGQVQTVLQGDSIIAVNELSDAVLDVILGQGNLSADTNGVAGKVALQNGIDISVNDNIEVAIDSENDQITSSCFEGTCTLTDNATGESLDLEQGQQLTFSESAPVLDAAKIVQIPWEIAFVTNRHGASEIYLMRPDGSNQVRITENGQIVDESPSWSPDGRFLAFVSNREGRLDIYTLDLTDNAAEPVNITDNFTQDREPAWSPDGTRIAFVSNGNTGIDDIYIMNVDGSDRRRITTTGGAGSPAWSPDGTQIAFSARPDGNEDIYILNPDDPDAIPENITFHPAADTDPAWSHDGSRIAFVSDRDNNLEIYVKTIGSPDDAQNISRSGGRDFEPAWSPDGQRVMFTSERYGDLDIVSALSRANPDTTDAWQVLRLTDESSASDQQAAWFPIIRAGQVGN